MSFRRKIHDGVLTGRDNSPSEWRNPIISESTVVKYASSGRSKKTSPGLKDFPEESEKDRYLITYADVITLLLGLFIILYSISNIDLQKFQKMKEAFGSSLGSGVTAALNNSSSELKIVPITTLKEKLAGVIESNNYQHLIGLEESDKGIIIHLSEEILFSSGKSEVDEQSYLVLTKIAAVIRDLPNEIRIEGHTDNIPVSSPSLKSNWHLSVLRALNTAYSLINTENLNPERVSIVGYSEYQPIASNEEPQGRAKNRRVDIVILKEKK